MKKLFLTTALSTGMMLSSFMALITLDMPLSAMDNPATTIKIEIKNESNKVINIEYALASSKKITYKQLAAGEAMTIKKEKTNNIVFLNMNSGESAIPLSLEQSELNEISNDSSIIHIHAGPWHIKKQEHP